MWVEILQGLAESLAMAFLGTFIAAVIAVPLGFLGARNVMNVALLRFSLRRVLDGFRGVDQLIWALAYVRAVGLGPLAGVLAIATADIAVLAKLYAEAIENAEKRQAEGIAGGRRLAHAGDALRHPAAGGAGDAGPRAVLLRKQHALRRHPGRGGRGGIGLQIAERIRVRHWDEVAFIIILMVRPVAAIDWLSARIRRRLIGDA
jgi:phosphonate transport system permease protein